MPRRLLKPSSGTREVPVTNCSSFALSSWPNEFTIFQNHWIAGLLSEKPVLGYTTASHTLVADTIQHARTLPE